ncbi:NUDIX hydrolase [Rhizobium lemnae]|uniref:NUDIX hydrolase n=1 Tax=Rhizobium lemnae TaxID=1214924 RepID=A0ABV8E8S4_9HYPH|nr:NUDIX hydrolase [Rhizobium lemnae]
MSLLDRITENILLMMRRPPRQQYAALCYRIDSIHGLQILLLTSRETRRWVIPKGWPMKGKKAHAVAEREALEEAGVRGTAEKEAFGHFGYLKKLKNGLKVPVRVQVHPLRVDAMVDNFKEKGVRDLDWADCQTAASRVQEPELRNLILAFGNHPDHRVSSSLKAVGR